eukprot:Lithocolla_globosa_v1_NODE_10670_length_578_cov_2468.967495.p1 type:complete len:139 gc:universal NODE_10670_length_578_cov_2468.967495:85-501(+)
MNSPLVIKNFKTLTFSAQINDLTDQDATFSKQINLEFIPDEIILKNVSLYNYDINTTAQYYSKMFLLKSSLLSDNGGVLASIPHSTAYHEQYHISFKNNSPINGTYSFTLTDIFGAKPGGGANYNTFISLTLMFVKYK